VAGVSPALSQCVEITKMAGETLAPPHFAHHGFSRRGCVFQIHSDLKNPDENLLRRRFQRFGMRRGNE
jgi:hypothetical protein